MTGNIAYDARRMFRHACSFVDCALFCEKTPNSIVVRTQWYTVPEIVNSAFACEIFMKSVLIFRGIRAWNYVYHLDNSEVYSSVSDEMLIDLIENSAVIKSYWESNPFEADERKKEWLEDIRNAAYKAVDKSKLDFDAEGNEIVLDMLCYMGYRAITQKEGKATVDIVADIYECIKSYCEDLVERVE